MAAKQVEIETDVEPEAKKRSLTVPTVKKWVLDNEKILETSTWLTYDTSKTDCTVVTSLKCSVCIQFEQKLRRQRNFNAAFIVGLTNTLRSCCYRYAHARNATLL